MNLEEIKRIIVDQGEEMNEIFERERIIERDIPRDELMKFIEHSNILAILGVRRSGKSIFSHLLLQDKKFGYVNFDDERFAGLEAENLNNVLQAFYELYGTDLEYLILDEIQNIPGWELFANRMRRTKKVIITGSNARLLSGELATHLTGRYIDFVLYPFSFPEYLEMKNFKLKKESVYSTKKIAELKKALEDYISTGGFPESYKFGRPILRNIYEDIIYKDILLRYRIRNRKTFSEMTKYLLSQFSSEITYTKLKNIMTIKNVHTVKNYVDYISRSYLLFILERYSPKLKKQIIAPKKVYCIDTGLINSIAFMASENKGRLMENVVAVELMRRKSYRHHDMEIYYWKDHQHREVDFVLKRGRKIERLVQVTNLSGKDELKRREINSLVRASHELKCKNLLIITWDYEDKLEADGRTISCIPLWKWLVSDKITE